MPKCVDQSFPCQNPDYSEFDRIASVELYDPPSAHQIVNESQFCTFVPVDEAIQCGDLTHRDFLKGLHGKSGIYHLWVDYDECDDHGTHTLLCVYVGKGQGEIRINRHIKEKWPDNEYLYVTFYECRNRIAKYLEQLFLDTYQFYLNEYENGGENRLFAVWDDERHFMGTELHSVSDRSNIQSIDDI